MFEQVQSFVDKYEEITAQLADPEVLRDQARWQKLNRERARLEEIVEAYRDYQRLQSELHDAHTVMNEATDPELFALAQSEIEDLNGRLAAAEDRLKKLLIPRDPNDDRNVIMEIRAGAGGEEAALFAADLFRMYSRYAEKKGWRLEVMDANETDIGGFKEIVFLVEGAGAYSRLKFESGVHRVQRVPETEAAGRIHTSTATVAVLPEAEEVEVNINPDDLIIETYSAGGPGGQHVNKTESAVRIIHKPTGIVATCQDERSQHKNRDKAMKVLYARLLDYYQSQQEDELTRTRRLQVGTGDRSERIRTYNFPENRLTDHRIKLTLYQLAEILEGELDPVVDALAAEDQAKRLWQAQNA